MSPSGDATGVAGAALAEPGADGAALVAGTPALARVVADTALLDAASPVVGEPWPHEASSNNTRDRRTPPEYRDLIEESEACCGRSLRRPRSDQRPQRWNA
jgi:hypothetical protein